ncbi:acetoacetate--CoA ligase [Paenarthrobacter sp. NPDC089322]|uniref:acetoacetate--CoA ligase n=1 Tax=Paenarthrobacter sp. NPDC089322 TaxID=3155065 RepID=UPI003448349E
MAQKPTITWTPTDQQRHETRLWSFMRWMAENRGVQTTTYREIWRWSVEEMPAFWGAVREYFDVLGDALDGPVLASEHMPSAVWFPEARLNFAENLLRHAQDPKLANRVAIYNIDEHNNVTTITWKQLEGQVASLAAHLDDLGVGPSDVVAAVLPNIPEAIIGLLATASLGAIWTINSPDLSATATLDRIRQLEPRILIGADGYQFNGKHIDQTDHLAAVENGLPGLSHTIVVRADGKSAPTSAGASADAHSQWLGFDELTSGNTGPSYRRLPFSHPLWVLFSSGTTGQPKGIVHGHGGITLEALKGTGLNQDMGPGDIYYVAANTSWMVWNTLSTNLMAGASIVTYAGSPTFGSKDRQFEIISLTGATMFAVGAAYLSLVEKAGLCPRSSWNLSSLRSILSTGSPLPESTWLWVHDEVKSDVHLGSDTGGTDICSGFIGSNPLESVHLGELQGPLLGVAVQAWSEDGERVVDQVGDMVITRPMPSMPVFLWGDKDAAKYKESYFWKFPGTWVQGDWITETSRGTFIVHGRSDATLNRFGVRMGSADIYAALQHVPEIKESLVIGLELPGGGYYMPLFVALEQDVELDEDLKARITATIRANASARHVPDEIIVAPDIPLTHARKKIEVPIKNLFAGKEPAKAVNLASLANPSAVPWFIEQAKQFRHQHHPSSEAHHVQQSGPGRAGAESAPPSPV